MWAQSRSEVDVAPITYQMQGTKEVVAKLDALGVDTQHAILRAVETAIRDVAGHADEMVPEDTGQLRASQDIVDPQRRGNQVEASISYGGPSAPYALVQHENFDLWHPPRPPGNSRGRTGMGPTEPGDRTNGGPKYLEYPFTQETQSYPEGFKHRLIAAGMDILRPGN
jgi:hypothetical protein|tara:strand:+ start:74 stop:577 length:504 start_codon:yes stop_codon:yes gene_type:complete